MFCQQCGAELRVEAGFCAICGTEAPQPKLHIDQPEKGKQKPPSPPARQPKAANDVPFSSALPSGAMTSGGHASSSLVPAKSQPSYEAIRQASSYRSNARHVAPIASLEVRSSAESPAPNAAAPELAPAVSAAPVQERAILTEQPEVAQPPQAPAVEGTPQYVVIGSQAPIVLSAASVVPLQPQPVQNGRHLNGHQQPTAVPRRAEDVLAGGSYTRQLIGATRGVHMPQDVPNRIALGALAAMFLCFFLPWVIIGGVRATPLSMGWPVVLPLVVLAGAMLTILIPHRALYARFFLALPLGLGCFGLGCALLLFLLSSAIAANNVGASFLGVDIGFAFFVVAALALTIGGYYKLLRELPLLQSGQLRLAPLPGILRVLSESPAHASAQPAAPVQQAPLPTGNAAPDAFNGNIRSA
jgi:hypothetical protein